MVLWVVWRSAQKDCYFSWANRKISLNDRHSWTRIIFFATEYSVVVKPRDTQEVYLSLSFLPWLYLGFVSTLLFFAGYWEQFAIVDTTIWENYVSEQQWLGGEKILQCCLLATFCNYSTKARYSSGSRPICLFVLIIHKVLMYCWTRVSCCVFILGDVDERVSNGKVLCIPDLDL